MVVGARYKLCINCGHVLEYLNYCKFKGFDSLDYLGMIADLLVIHPLVSTFRVAGKITYFPA